MKIYGLRLNISEIDRVLELLSEQKVAIGWSVAGNLTSPSLTKADLRARIKAAYPTYTPRALTFATTDLWRFVREMDIGDILVIPHGQDIYFAKVAGPVSYVKKALADDMVHQRTIMPLLGSKPLRRHDLPDDLREGLNFRHATDDLSSAEKTVLKLVGLGASETLKACQNRTQIRRGLRTWEGAFKLLGRTNHGFSERLYWVDDLGIGLLNGSWIKKGKDRHWYGFGNRLAGSRPGNLIVEVNPPDSGPPGHWQGMVARDAKGRDWILHRGELNLGSRRTQLSQEPESKSLSVMSVRFADGTIKDGFVVAQLDADPASIATQTKRFVDVCARVRTKYEPNSPKFLEDQARAQAFEESIGTTVIPPQPQKEIDRYHARVWHALRDALLDMKFQVYNSRVSALGPDLYTVCEDSPYLFEIKTRAGSSDCLKGVGQLIVYEHVLKRKFRKMLVVPDNIREAFVSVFQDLGIDVVLYEEKASKFKFDWPTGFTEAH